MLSLEAKTIFALFKSYLNSQLSSVSPIPSCKEIKMNKINKSASSCPDKSPKKDNFPLIIFCTPKLGVGKATIGFIYEKEGVCGGVGGGLMWGMTDVCGDVSGFTAE